MKFPIRFIVLACLSNILVFDCTAAESSTAAWLTAKVPGAWETNGPAAAKAYDGIAWYKTWVKPHDSFFSKHERNLFEESVTINIRDLADAHEVFVNGTSIGTGGTFPPSFAPGTGMIHRHKVPPGTLRKGEWNEIAIRVYNQSGAGGFLGEAPFIMNYFMECVLEGTWLFQLGNGSGRTGGALAERPAASAFDQFAESSRVLGEAAETVPGPRKSPEESLAVMRTADDLVVDDLVHEPLVTQPVHMSFDERGRMWVAQYRQYPYPAGLKMISRDKYYRSHYDRIPPAPPNHDRGRDIISIHEDTNGDGVYDRHKVFLDGLNMANSALRGRGGVWVMHTPYLLFYPDKDFDDVPDGPPVVHLQGFGLEDTHSVANGLVWGMDGWLYGGQGSTTSSRVTRPGLDPADAPGVRFEGCMVWRYHPETRQYELFAEGSGNTFGLEIDDEGRLFSGHNGGSTRGWHYVQGGLYLKQGFDPGKFGPPRNPYSFGQLPMMKSENAVQRFSHIAAVVEGTALPDKYSGTFFSVDPLHNVVIASERNTLGATFATRDIGAVLESSDPGFRPVYIANAPDGSIVIADFYEYYIAHGQHYQSHIDRTTGRIYRLRGKSDKLETDLNLEKKSDAELIAMLAHPNKWHRQTAVRLLGERRDPETASKLERILREDNGTAALGALWALHQASALHEETARQAVEHAYAPVRMWAVRLLCDDGTISELTAAALASRSKTEGNAEVRSQFASSARRLPVRQALPIVTGLLEHDEDLNDPYLPQLCWWVLEAHAEREAEPLLRLFENDSVWVQPMVFEHIVPRVMRRYALDGRRESLLNCARLLRMAPTSKHAAQLMKGFEEAFRGRAITGLPDELVAAMDATGQLPLMVRVRRGEPAAIEQALTVLENPKAPMDERLQLARAFGEATQADARAVLIRLATGEGTLELRKVAMVALGSYGDDEVGRKIVEAMSTLPETLRGPAAALLASRGNWSLRLLQSVEAGGIDRGLLSPDLVDRMRLHDDEQIAVLLKKIVPQQDSGTAEVQKRLAEVGKILTQGTGNPYAGESSFMERCASCHKFFFKGGKIGPDLTPYQRDNLETMLPSIINPNLEIREGYEYYIVETSDDRSLSGFLVERDNQVTVLRGLEGEDIVLRGSEIKTIQPMGRSLMPEGLLEGLSDQELRDLFAYLRISQPITR